MRTFASLFSGGGGADIGAIAAGLKPIWGVELKAEIAEWYAVNIGHPAIVGDVCEVDFSKLESPFWLHMSPPCVTASVANAKAGEGDTDRALAAACVRAIEALKPEWVSLENVGGYQAYESYAAIKDALTAGGYRFVEDVLNTANYGVPQTRRRLFLIASRVALPALPRPTHSDKEGEQMQLSMFDAPLLPWVGWYEAIADLIPTLPKSKLAPWQLKRLPPDLSTTLLGEQRTTQEEWAVMNRPADAPAFAMAARDGESDRIKAVLMDPSYQSDKAWGSKAPRSGALDPAYTVKATTDEANNVAVLIDGKMNHYGESVTVPNGDAPSFTATAQNTTRQPLSAVLVHATINAGVNHGCARSATVMASEKTMEPKVVLLETKNGARLVHLSECGEPSSTALTEPARFKVVSAGRVVRLTPRALARLQSFPDAYALPDDRRLAGRIIGNAVPPLLMQRVIEAQL